MARFVKSHTCQHTGTRPLEPKTLELFGSTNEPEGRIFLIGDNRNFSFDSRDPRFGVRSISDVKGRPLRIVDSPDPARRGKSLD
jgi:hypothetical protein